MTVEDTAPSAATERAAAAKTLSTLGNREPAGSNGHGRNSIPQATIAVGFAVLLLVLATTSQGAFAISRWAPLTLFVLALLLGATIVPAGRAHSRPRSVRLAVGAIWGLALWSLLSMLWAKSSGSAFQAADRMSLYAAIVTLPFALPISRRSLAAVGWAVSAGIGAVAVYVMIRLRVDGAPLFLAGRLNAPIDYRNATALLFALPVWPFVIAAAAKTNRRPLRAAALSLASLCLGLTFMTQSRGILIGLCLGGCVALAVGPDRVRRAWLAILAVAGVALASPWLLRPYHAFTGDRPSATAPGITVAATALVVVTVGLFAVGMAVALFDQGLRANPARLAVLRRAARLALAVVVVVGVVSAAAAVGNPVTFARHKWDQFRDLNGNTNVASTRYLSVGGQRYDLWRVAVKEFAQSPILGAGADNYQFGYYRYRETNRNLSDPHSLLFSLLSELGIVGVGLFCAFVVGMLGATRRGWRSLEDRYRRAVAASAAAGTVLLGQSMVDWIWLIPGLTAIGLFLLSVGAALSSPSTAGGRQVPRARPEHARFQTLRPVRARAPWLRLAAIGGLVAAMLAVLALFLSNAYIQRARSAISDPPAELSAAKLAAELDPWNVDPHYLEASADETMGNRRSAYRQLRDALALEPANFATLGVLGDFEARGGDFDAARAYYRRALALDPLDVGLRQLSRIGEPSPR